MSEVSFRRALPDDAVCLSQIAFAAKSRWGYPVEWMELWRPDLTISRYYLQTEKVCIAENSGEVIGFVGLSFDRGGRQIEHLWLRPAHIGRGLGRKLFEEAVRMAREEGAAELFIRSDPNAEAFYLKMGATRMGQDAYSLPDGGRREIPLLVYRVG